MHFQNSKTLDCPRPTSITLLCLLWQKRLSALLVLSSRVQCWNVTIIILQPSLNIFVFWLSVSLLLSTNCQNNTFALFLFLAHYELIAMRWIAVIIMCQPFATIWKKPYVLAKFMPWHHKKTFGRLKIVSGQLLGHHLIIYHSERVSHYYYVRNVYEGYVFILACRIIIYLIKVND